MSNNQPKTEVTTEELKIPNFMCNNKTVTKSSNGNELKFIKLSEEDSDKKNWKILKELDDMIGSILYKPNEPIKSVVEYSFIDNNSNKTERTKGVIKIKK